MKEVGAGGWRLEAGGWRLKGAAAAEPLATMVCTHAPLLLPTSQLQAPGSRHTCMHACMVCTYLEHSLPGDAFGDGQHHACVHAHACKQLARRRACMLYVHVRTWNTACPAMCLVTVGVSSGWSGRLGGRSSMASTCDAWVWTVMGISGCQS